VESGSLSKAQFVKQADAICQKRVVEVQLKFRPLSRRFASASPAEQEAEASKFVNDVIEVPTDGKPLRQSREAGEGLRASPSVAGLNLNGPGIAP
jgi:hypothetical protein